MTTVRKLIGKSSRTPVAVSPNDSVLDALRLMADHDIGSVLVLDGGSLAGIFTERDYARKVTLMGKVSRDTRVRDIMTEKVYYVTPERTVEECMALMTDKRCRHLPVLDDQQRVIGLVSIGDLVKEIISHQEFLIKQLEDYIKG